MPCPRCRIALVSGNGKGKSTGGNGESWLRCPKCGYRRKVCLVRVAMSHNPHGRNGRPGGADVSQKPYYRDIWALGPSSNGYPGAFPRGFVRMVKRKWWGKKRLWLFSGSYKDRSGTTVDINPDVKPDYVCNCEELPFPDNSYDFVMADPPYSAEESLKLYGLPYVSIIKTLNEMIRVCKPGGHVLFFHRLVPAVFPGLNLSKQTQLEAVVGIFTISGMANIRALTVFRKYQTLEAYQEEVQP